MIALLKALDVAQNFVYDPGCSRAFAWSGDAKKLSSNDSFGKNVAIYSKLGQNEREMSAFFCIGSA
jgi:hypothetical protein